jgi:selenocysteine lyase/cysteine desulfurase
METIHERVCRLAECLLEPPSHAAPRERSPAAAPLRAATTEARGGIITLNFLDAKGRTVDHREIEDRAAAARISLRTGCFCNPGGAETAFGITADEVSACFAQADRRGSLTHEDLLRCVPGKPMGAVRVRLGLASNVADLQRFLHFAGSLRSP